MSNRDPFDNDWFDKRFERHEKRVDNMLDNPARTFFKMGLIAVVLNLIFWGLIIAGVIFGLSFLL